MDIRHFSEDEIADIIKTAIEDATNEQVPEDLRVAVFEQSVALRSKKTITKMVPGQGAILPPH